MTRPIQVKPADSESRGGKEISFLPHFIAPHSFIFSLTLCFGRCVPAILTLTGVFTLFGGLYTGSALFIDLIYLIVEVFGGFY